jgi:HD-like signal output (HDOD) protein
MGVERSQHHVPGAELGHAASGGRAERTFGRPRATGGAHRPARPPWHPTAEELADLVGLVHEYFDAHRPEPASFPAMAARVIDVAEHPEVDVARLAHLIERDPAIAAAVLAVANSAAYRRAVPVKAVRTALALLGTRQVASIAVGVACRSLFDVDVRAQHELYPHLWARQFHAAMTEAFAGAFVAMDRHVGASDSVFLAGMFHDLGKSLTLRSLGGLLVGGALPGMPTDAAIDALVHKLHVELGVEAHRVFRLPESLLEACRRQRDATLPKGPEWADAHIVRVVSGINDLRVGGARFDDVDAALLSSARALRFTGDELRTLAQQVAEHAAQVTVLFSVADHADEEGYADRVESVAALLA